VKAWQVVTLAWLVSLAHDDLLINAALTAGLDRVD
jgi:hypothetical protein